MVSKSTKNMFLLFGSKETKKKPLKYPQEPKKPGSKKIIISSYSTAVSLLSRPFSSAQNSCKIYQKYLLHNFFHHPRSPKNPVLPRPPE
jgi:hypothetical protein